MEITRYRVRIVTIEPLLGTQPQKDVATEFITSRFAERVKAAGISTNDADLPEDELGTLTEQLEKGTTVFHRLNGAPIYYDYHVKGFLKESAQVQNGSDGVGGVKNLKSKVNNLVFVFPRQIALHIPDGGTIEYLERPLRAQTMQGPRTSLARSEMLPVGTWFECEIRVLSGEIKEKAIRSLLDYGELKGLGQWRNGSYGRFEYTLDKA